MWKPWLPRLLRGLLIVGVILVWWGWPDRVTQENYTRVKDATTRTEVESILGRGAPFLTQRDEPGGTTLLWEGDAGSIIVTFNASGHRTFCSASPEPLEPPTGLLGRLQLRLKRKWDRSFPRRGV